MLDCTGTEFQTRRSLDSLDAVEAGSSLPGPDDPVGAGEEHVLLAPHRHPGLGQAVRVAVLAQQALQLLHRHSESL